MIPDVIKAHVYKPKLYKLQSFVITEEPFTLKKNAKSVVTNSI